MIFVTVGTQFPFDRMVSAVDEWSSANQNVRVYAQIGEGAATSFIDSSEFLDPEKYSEILERTSLIVSHAGMGTILTAFEKKIPIVIMPREFSLGEHRNDHQLSTVQKFSDVKGVYIARDEAMLKKYLDDRECLSSPSPSFNNRCQEINEFITGFVGGSSEISTYDNVNNQ